MPAVAFDGRGAKTFPLMQYNLEVVENKNTRWC